MRTAQCFTHSTAWTYMRTVCFPQPSLESCRPHRIFPAAQTKTITPPHETFSAAQPSPSPAAENVYAASRERGVCGRDSSNACAQSSVQPKPFPDSVEATGRTEFPTQPKAFPDFRISHAAQGVLGPPVAAARALLVPWVRCVAAAGVFLGQLGETSVLLGHLAAAARALLAAWGRIIAAAARACLGNFGPISAVLGHLAVTARGLLVS
jgi:hypothetical protein